jgi:hypothetical protein
MSSRQLTLRSSRQLKPELLKLKEHVNRSKNKRVIEEAVNDLLKLRARNGGYNKYGDLSEIINKYQAIGYSFVTRNSISYSLKHRPVENSNDSLLNKNIDVLEQTVISSLGSESVIFENVDADVEVEVDSNESKKGRKKGTTKANAKIRKENYLEALESAAKKFAAEKQKAINSNRKVSNGLLQAIIVETEKEYNLPLNSIKYGTVKKRVSRNNLSGACHQSIPPLLQIEPYIVEWCIRLSNMGAALTKDQVINLADSLIKGTSFHDEFVAFKKKRGLFVPKEGIIVGNGWYNGFMERNSAIIHRRQGRVKDMKRHSWCVYENFESMYESVYKTMVKSNVAEELESECFFDKKGNIVQTKEESFGLPSKYKLKHPNYCIFVDETGKNTNMKADGKVGGEKFVVPVNAVTNTGCIGSTTDIHFTVLCFTAATGEAVMCSVIFKSELKVCQLPISWTMGININKDILTGIDNVETFSINQGKGKAMEGGPICFFNGKNIPCFIGASPKASITSTMLADMLRFMDDLNVFDRSTGITPFLLLDGHHSRLELPFLTYINDDKNKWNVCIGVPYGTHLWQVADAEEQNGTFSLAITKAKREMYKNKPDGQKKFLPSDIIPLVNEAFPKSFGNQQFALTAIAERGWGPLNYNLLLHPDLLATRSINTCNVQDSSSVSNSQSTVITQLNTTTGSAAKYLNSFILEEAKNKARLEIMKKEKEENDNLLQRVKNLQDVTRLSSGVLFTKRKQHLDDDVLHHVRGQIANKDQQELEKKAKKQVREDSLLTKYVDAKKKYINNSNNIMVLTSTDLHTLIKYTQQPNDSPVRKTVVERRQQFERRRTRLYNDGVVVEPDAAAETLITDNGGYEGAACLFGIDESEEAVEKFYNGGFFEPEENFGAAAARAPLSTNSIFGATMPQKGEMIFQTDQNREESVKNDVLDAFLLLSTSTSSTTSTIACTNIDNVCTCTSTNTVNVCTCTSTNYDDGDDKVIACAL